MALLKSLFRTEVKPYSCASPAHVLNAVDHGDTDAAHVVGGNGLGGGAEVEGSTGNLGGGVKRRKGDHENGDWNLG